MTQKYKHLYFSLFTQNLFPDIEKEVCIYTEKTLSFLSKPFRFCIIGESHFVFSPDYNYGEIFSCLYFPNSLHSIDLLHQLSKHSYTKLCDAFNVEIMWDIQPFESEKEKNYLKNTATLFYEFADHAYTSITIHDNYFETMHTYPELQKQIYTCSKFIHLHNGFE